MELIGFLENEDRGSFWGEGGGVFLLIEQWTCILSGWNLTLILDPRSRFSRKPKDLLFEEVTIRSISTEGWLTMHMLWSTSSLLYIPRDNFMIYNVKTLKVYLLIYFFPLICLLFSIWTEVLRLSQYQEHGWLSSQAEGSELLFLE